MKNTKDKATENSNFDDRDLVAFLKQNQPIAPPTNANLQALIMEQVGSLAIAKPVKKIPFQKIGLLGAAIVTAVTLIIFNQPRPMQTALNETESLKIEKSLINNWHIAEEEFTTSYSLISSSSK